MLWAMVALFTCGHAGGVSNDMVSALSHKTTALSFGGCHHYPSLRMPAMALVIPNMIIAVGLLKSLACSVSAGEVALYSRVEDS